MTNESSPPDLMLMGYFFSVLNQLCKHRNLTLQQVVAIINYAFKEDRDAWHRIFNKILLDQEAQKTAEKALADIAATMNIKRQYRTRFWSENPGRDIDWSQTLLRTMTGDKGRFCNIARAVQIDRQLAAGLATIAREWLQAVQTYDPSDSNRITGLINALQALSSNAQSMHVIAWSTWLERKLYQEDPERTQAISRARSLWLRRTIQGKNLAEALKDLWGEKTPDLNNPDNLFEWIMTNRIGISAQSTGWDWVEGRDGADFFCRQDNDWQLAIYKGNLRDKGTKREKEISDANDGKKIKDAIQKAYKDTGMESHGMIPDIVIEFFKGGAEEGSASYYFIADAKRNTKDLQKNYIRASINKAAVYLYAFDDHLKLHPKCTLFFWQGVDKVLKKSKKDGRAINFGESGDRPILCLDLDWIESEDKNNEPSEGRLSDWLDHLFNQAKQEHQKNTDIFGIR